jgi:hypothetical protein
LEFEDAWLEVRACAGSGQAAGADHRMLEVGVISEVLEAAASANRHSRMWDYSRRLDTGERESIQSTLKFTKTAEDSRSVSHSVDVAYKGSCYTLTLFAIKRSQ